LYTKFEMSPQTHMFLLLTNLNNEKKNFRPCLITNCTYKDVTFHSIMELAYQKCYKKNILEIYPYFEVEKQICHLHYCKIVEPNHENLQYKWKKELKDQEGHRKRIVQNLI